MATCREFEAPEDEVSQKKEKLKAREKSVKILVTGLTGTGKSTLINAMMGNIVACAEFGPKPVTSKPIEVHKGEYEEIRIKVYDTAGFGDSTISEKKILKNISTKTPRRGFDLILITIRMDSRMNKAVQQMLSTMGKLVDAEMWKRTVVVLTFANGFLMQVRENDCSDGNKEYEYDQMERIKAEIKETFLEFAHISDTEIAQNIPFVVAGGLRNRNLPKDDDWLVTLWDTSVLQCRGEARNFLKCLRIKRLVMELRIILKGFMKNLQDKNKGSGEVAEDRDDNAEIEDKEESKDEEEEIKDKEEDEEEESKDEEETDNFASDILKKVGYEH